MTRTGTPHEKRWRDPHQVIAQWSDAGELAPGLLRSRASGGWWDLLAQLDLTLLVTREYEHLVVALSAPGGKPAVSYLRLPHPSGLAWDRETGAVHVASTRNPNHLVELRPASGLLKRADVDADQAESLLERRPLLPARSRYLPGSLYLHDLALIGGRLYGNAVGSNTVVELDYEHGFERAWWPRSVEVDGRPRLERNYIQLNSIAAGPDLAGSYFTASSEGVSARRPTHRNYPVDGRGVLISGATREAIARGLTRPHSARLREGSVWIANSGYGELVRVEGGALEHVTRLPGWTRGLGLAGEYAFVGTSRVIRRFSAYAPGLDPDRCRCGLHAVELATGRIVAGLEWPTGDQIFAVEPVPSSFTRGLPFQAGARAPRSEKRLFYAFDQCAREDSV